MRTAQEKGRILLLGDATQVHLSRWSSYLSDVGYEVLALSLEPVDTMPGRSQRVLVNESLPNAIRYSLATSAVKRLARDFQPDVVNAHFVPNYGWIASLAGFDNWVLSTWGSDIMTQPRKSVFHMWRTRFVIDRATYITSDADVMTRRLIELGAMPDRVLTFPFGVDRNVFRPTDTRGGGAPRILSNRKLEAVYDIATIITAFAILHSDVPDARLTVAGSGRLHKQLENQAASGVASNAIEFVGNIVHERMPDSLRSHDIYVSMAQSDTTSVSLLEAMACGLFPIVSDIPANREWIEDGASGFLVTVGDADKLARRIEQAWRDDALRESARKANRRAIDTRADWHTNMAVVHQLFERMMGRTG